MLEFIEVNRVDPELGWIEVLCSDTLNLNPTVIHLVIREPQDMVILFTKRYLTKQAIEFKFSENTLSQLENFFGEAHLARVMDGSDEPSSDALAMLKTNCVNFKYPERSSLRKSRPIRVKLFLDEAYQHLTSRRYDQALKRLEWIHILEPDHTLAFELKIVVLRSSKKISACIAVFEEWIEQHPEAIEPKLGLSELWLYLDQHQKAKDALMEVRERVPNHPLVLIGLAQAKARLGEDYLSELLKASVVDLDYTKEMVEHYFNFSSMNPQDLAPATLTQIAEDLNMPLKRLVGRAQRGVLPFHTSQHQGLLLFSAMELERYRKVLTKLGLELQLDRHETGAKTVAKEENPESGQMDLFEQGDT